MAICFNSLPTQKTFDAEGKTKKIEVEAGIYKAKVVDAAMKQKKDGSGQYLNIRMQLTKGDGAPAGTLWDIISESSAAVCLYKLSRLLRACNIPLEGTMELEDIGKIIKGRELVVDVGPDKTGRMGVDLFTHEAYYQIGEWDDVCALVGAPAADPEPDGFMNVPTPETQEEMENDYVEF